MPRPAYIVFSDSGAADQHTNRVSVFDVVEVVQVAFRKPEEMSSPLPTRSKPQRVTAVWCREDQDSPGTQFESQVVCLAPDGTEIFHTEVVPFKFTMIFQRFDLPGVQIPGFTVLGLHTIEARLRRDGQQEWEWRQSFPFAVQEAPQPTTPPTSLVEAP